MNTYRFTAKTQCGKTDVSVQTADTLEEATSKFKRHIALKHSPMTLLKIETKVKGQWYKA